MFVIVFVVACFLAYSNGANDNFKGVATLFGSGTTNYRRAINWATITTFLGAIAAIFLAGTLVKNFSGKGLVPDALIQTPEFAIAIGLGAGLTVLGAAFIGMPISTTHSLIGGLFGSGVVAVGSTFNFAKLGTTFLMPTIVSPLIAAVGSFVAYFILKKVRVALGVQKSIMDEGQEHFYTGRFLGIKAQQFLDSVHFLSAGIVCFARGLNDTPKIVGLLLVINTLDIKWGMIAIAIGIAIGGLMNAQKVGVTVSKRITRMNHGQGFTANLVTGLLVTTASIHGMPVSTTHVAVGSIFGIVPGSHKADALVVKKILLAWLLTVPIAALFSALVYWSLLQL